MKEESNARDKPLIAQRTPCIVEWARDCLFGVNAVDRKCSRFAMDPLRGRISRRWRFTLKRRNAGVLVFYGCKQTKKPPFRDGISLADLIMWCRQRIQTASASDSVARWVCLHDPPKLAPCNHK